MIENRRQQKHKPYLVVAARVDFSDQCRKEHRVVALGLGEHRFQILIARHIDEVGIALVAVAQEFELAVKSERRVAQLALALERQTRVERRAQRDALGQHRDGGQIGRFLGRPQSASECDMST